MAVLQVFSGVTKTFSDEQKRAMNHGVENEINAIGTLCSIVMPSICPELTYHEEGIYIHDNIGVSPDGTLRKYGEVLYVNFIWVQVGYAFYWLQWTVFLMLLTFT